MKEDKTEVIKFLLKFRQLKVNNTCVNNTCVSPKFEKWPNSAQIHNGTEIKIE